MNIQHANYPRADGGGGGGGGVFCVDVCVRLLTVMMHAHKVADFMCQNIGQALHRLLYT